MACRWIAIGGGLWCGAASALTVIAAQSERFSLALLQHLDVALFIKLGLTAALVLVATGFATRFGAFIGAMIAAVPISVGPAYLFSAMEHDDAFVAQSALISLGVNPMTAVFLLVCAALVERFGIVVALLAGVGAWFVGALLITELGLTFEQACLLNAVVFAICIYLSRSLLGDVTGQTAKRGWLDTLLRVVAVVSVVGAAVIAGRWVGPKAFGLVAPIPVVWISMSVVTFARLGGATCSAVMANGIVPMVGFWLGMSALHLLAVAYGSTVALLAALALSVGFTLGLTLLRPYIPMYNNVRRVSAS